MLGHGLVKSMKSLNIFHPQFLWYKKCILYAARCTKSMARVIWKIEYV
jgi:hypothetical protein